MKERGLLLSGPIVQATRARRKTQTLRVIKRQPQYKPEHGYQWYRRRKDMVWEQNENAGEGAP